ncbi:MAG: zinc ribbon domain-containing protein, partial [Caldilineaceae bacterium]|nr:zinc ribbon domain-containing protein [Caldilineaceae bacterium]
MRLATTRSGLEMNCALENRTYSLRYAIWKPHLRLPGHITNVHYSMHGEGAATMADEQQVCPNCGNFNRAGARFCSKCGHVFKPLAVAAVPAAPAKAPTPPPKASATP